MEKYIATVSGVIGAFISYLVDGIGMAVSVLILMMAIDYITGLIAATYQRKLNSRIGFNGLLRKCYYLFMVSGVYAIQLIIPGIGWAGDGVAVGLSVMELISITENGAKMNLPMPDQVKKILLIVSDKINGNGKDDK